MDRRALPAGGLFGVDLIEPHNLRSFCFLGILNALGCVSVVTVPIRDSDPLRYVFICYILDFKLPVFADSP